VPRGIPGGILSGVFNSETATAASNYIATSRGRFFICSDGSGFAPDMVLPRAEKTKAIF
jgi:hypothetical protein